MIRKLLFATGLLFTAGVAHGQIDFYEDFESYTAGAYLAESAGDPWTTWGNVPGTEEDVMISTDQASSGTQSAEFMSATPETGGPTDILLKLGNLTSGQHGVAWMMYVPTGSGAYFNIQKTEEAGEEFAVEVVLSADNSIEFISNGTTDSSMTYPSDEWFEVGILVDLDMGQASMSIAGGVPVIWDYTTDSAGEPGLTQLGGINFFAYAGGDPVHYYIDDVSLVDLTVGVNEQVLGQATVYPNPVKDILTIDLPEASASTFISVVDLTGRVIIDRLNLQQLGTVARAQINMHGLAEGVYMVRIQDGSNEMVYRVVRN